MRYTVNPELISLANRKMFEKSAVVPPGGGADPAAMGAVPPVDPGAMAAMGGPPADPAAAGGAPPAPMADPMAAMAGPAPAPAPAPAPTAQPQGQKLKPEQMMQMLDYRLYNMQQQLTAIMNAMGVEVAPESLVLPPGTTGAPPAEAALPGGPMAPPPPDQGAAAAGGPPGGPLPPGGPMPPNAPPPDAMAKGAWWEQVAQATNAGSIGKPVPTNIADDPLKNAAGTLQTKASAIAAICRSLNNAS